MLKNRPSTIREFYLAQFKNFKELLLHINGAKVIEPSIDYNEYIPLDLSVFNKNLKKYKLSFILHPPPKKN